MIDRPVDRPSMVVQEVHPVEPPPGGFLQATNRGGATLRAAVNAWIGDVTKLADLFANTVDPDAGQSPTRPGATR